MPLGRDDYHCMTRYVCTPLTNLTGDGLYPISPDKSHGQLRRNPHTQLPAEPGIPLGGSYTHTHHLP